MICCFCHQIIDLGRLLASKKPKPITSSGLILSFPSYCFGRVKYCMVAILEPRGLEYIPTKRVIFTFNPVSSSASRIAASAADSPKSAPPPGKHHTSKILPFGQKNSAFFIYDGDICSYSWHKFVCLIFCFRPPSSERLISPAKRENRGEFFYQELSGNFH